MKKFTSKIAISGLIALFSLSFNSCKKAIDVGSPSTLITPDKVFESDGSATAATLSNYTSLGTFDANFIPNIVLYVDDLDQTTLNSTSNEFANGKLTITNGAVANMWQNLYVTIYKANANIAALESAPKISDNIKKQLLGEALFIRAYCYFNLVNLFGDIPLVLTTDVRITAILPRITGSEVYQQMVADLTQAKSLLNAQYPTSEKIRPNTYAASALLARVYLYMQNWEKANNEATIVINSGSYLLSTPGDVFRKNSAEAIWQLWNQTGNTSLNTLVPADSGDPSYILTPQLISSFEIGDQRKTFWTKNILISGQNFIAPYKYKINISTSGDNGEYTMYLRLAEQFLIRAEAKARLQTDLSGCLADMNAIRNRAGLSSLAITSFASMLTAIAHERQIEFFAEGGQRFFDLKRTNEINKVIAPIKLNWDNLRSPFLPIPQAQRIINQNLSQNPGY